MLGAGGAHTQTPSRRSAWVASAASARSCPASQALQAMRTFEADRDNACVMIAACAFAAICQGFWKSGEISMPGRCDRSAMRIHHDRRSGRRITQPLAFLQGEIRDAAQTDRALCSDAFAASHLNARAPHDDDGGFRENPDVSVKRHPVKILRIDDRPFRKSRFVSLADLPEAGEAWT